MIKQKPYYRNTEKLLFRYFARLKLLKHFTKPTVFIHDTIYESNATISDVGHVLNEIQLTDKEQDVIITFCQKMRAPSVRNSEQYALWISAIHKIHNEFINRNLIKGILYVSEFCTGEQ